MSDDDWGEDDGDDGDWGDDDDDPMAEGDWGDVPENEDGGEVGWEIEVENLFYTAEANRKDDPSDALAKFQQCVQLEEEKSDNVDKRFPALKYIVMLLFAMGKSSDMITNYEKLLGYASSVTPNELNTAIRTILNTIQESTDSGALQRMYEITLKFFKSEGKERFWFEYAMRLCKTYFDNKEYEECNKLLDNLHNSCKLDNGEDDLAKGAQLLEIYAIRMQVMGAKNDQAALNELFERTATLSADISDPKSMSIIKECWGKMYASLNNWQNAYNNFFEAFRMYQDIGHQNVRQCLKYVVMSSMLSESVVHPFATQEARVYQTNEAIVPIATLLEAFEGDDIRLFERTLAANKTKIMDDHFIAEHMDAVKLKLRSRVVVKLIKPYKRVRLEWLCKQLNATPEEIENLVVNLILDGSIQGRLDQIHSLLDLNFLSETDKLYNSLEGWMRSVRRLQETITGRSGRYEGGRGMGPMMGDYMAFDEDPFLYGDIDPMMWM